MCCLGHPPSQGSKDSFLSLMETPVLAPPAQRASSGTNAHVCTLDTERWTGGFNLPRIISRRELIRELLGPESSFLSFVPCLLHSPVTLSFLSAQPEALGTVLTRVLNVHMHYRALLSKPGRRVSIPCIPALAGSPVSGSSLLTSS